MDYKSKQSRGWKVALAYFDLLGKPLTIRELRRYSWGEDLSWDRLSDEAKIFRHSFEGRELYSFKTVSAIDLEENARREGEYWSWVNRHSWVFALVPFVRLVMVMNGLAHGWVNGRSDIDVAVVTKSGRLWTARFWTIFLLTILGIRARGERKAMLFSPEFFVDEEHMNLKGVGSDSEYMNAYWIADFSPIAFGGRFLKFWSENKWLSRCLPVAFRSPKVGLGATQNNCLVTRIYEWVFGGWLGDKIEMYLGKWQKTIVARNIQRLGVKVDSIVDDHVLKLHFNSQRPRMVEEAVARVLE